ncbi:MAG TPA: DUF2059 domain-containing protein [Acidobacteriaceae bacterium]|jgi:hypothetical protein|nr:DUF2059 domain-containing protein [Acidobacteriaceae bacterium]
MPIRLRLQRLSLLLLLVLCLPLTAHADEASHHAKAAQMVELLHTERMVQQNTATILKQISDAAEQEIGANPTPQNKMHLAEFEKKASQLIDAQVGWKALQPALIDLYAQTFTEQELDAIIAFYKTPAGIALLDKMPAINDQIEQLAKSKLTILQPQIRQALEDFRKTLAPAPSATTPAASPAPPVSKSK